MQNTRFVVLTGHLGNYPLSDLIGILRHQRKSGRLTIEYAIGPASFFFQDGELVDAKLNELSGLQAICVAVAQPEAAFNFNPLIKPPRRSIEKEHQRVVSELFGCWDESFTQVEARPAAEQLPAPAAETIPEPPKILEPVKHEPLALMAAPQQARSYSLLLGIAAGLILVGLSTGIAVTGGFSRKDALPPGEARQVTSELESSKATQSGKSGEVATKSNRQRRQDPRSAAKNNVASDNQPVTESKTTSSKDDSILSSVNVVMQVENGRVVKASVANPRPGMDSYEALALRIARQRRFSDKTNGEQSVRINVSKKD